MATHSFLPVSPQELREPIPHKQQDLDVAFSEAATPGHVRSRAHTPARKCLRSYLIFSRTAFEKWHGTAHPRWSTLQHIFKITIERTKNVRHCAEPRPSGKSAFICQVWVRAHYRLTSAFFVYSQLLKSGGIGQITKSAFAIKFLGACFADVSPYIYWSKRKRLVFTNTQWSADLWISALQHPVLWMVPNLW